MKIELKTLLATYLRANKENKHKINLVNYLQEQICKYSSQENRPAEQIKGMNIILNDIIRLEDEVFNERNSN